MPTVSTKSIQPSTRPEAVGIINLWTFDDNSTTLVVDRVGSDDLSVDGAIYTRVPGPQTLLARKNTGTTGTGIAADTAAWPFADSLEGTIFGRFNMDAASTGNDYIIEVNLADNGSFVQIFVNTTTFKVTFNLQDTSIGTAISVNNVVRADRWQTFAFTWDNGDQELYVNGVSIATESETSIDLSGSGAAEITLFSTDTGINDFIGKIAGPMAFWDRRLATAEMERLHKSPELIVNLAGRDRSRTR